MFSKLDNQIQRARNFILALYGYSPSEPQDLLLYLADYRKRTVAKIEPKINSFYSIVGPFIALLCFTLAPSPMGMTLALTFLISIPASYMMRRLRTNEDAQSRIVTYVVSPILIIGPAIAFGQALNSSLSNEFKLVAASIYTIAGGAITLFNFSYRGEVILNVLLHVSLGSLMWQGQGRLEWTIAIFVCDFVAAAANALFFNTLANTTKVEYLSHKIRLENNQLKIAAFEKEVSLAQQIQESLNSKIDLIRFRGMQVRLFQERHQSLSGDWMGARVTESGELVLAVADVTGKGISAAMVARSIHALWAQAESHSVFRPEVWLTEVNRTLRSIALDSLQTATIGVVVVGKTHLRYYCCGHLPLYYKCKNQTAGQYRAIMRPGSIIGMLSEPYISPIEIAFAEEDLISIIIGTDGVFHRGTRTSSRELESFVSDLNTNGTRAIQKIKSNDDKMLILVSRNTEERTIKKAS